jgi:hypothetical protein
MQKSTPSSWREADESPTEEIRAYRGEVVDQASDGGAAMRVCVPNVWPAPDLQVDFYDLVSISLQ